MDQREVGTVTQSEDRKRVTLETADRLRSRGIWLDGRETLDQLGAIDDAVGEFEEAVVARGGDLMVDEGAPGREPQPDDPHFALPTRRTGEPVAAYLERLVGATMVVQRHRPLE